MNRRRTAILAAVAGLILLGATMPAAAASGSSSNVQKVQVRDDCDPTTFNQVLGEGACVGDGDTTFDEFVEEAMDEGEVGAWRFNPDDVDIDKRERLRAISRGGEFHTFTEVAEFGPGCVPELNALTGIEGEPIEECNDPSLFGTTGVPPGGTLDVGPLAPGTHFFECLIHPWMQTTVHVEHHHH